MRSNGTPSFSHCFWHNTVMFSLMIQYSPSLALLIAPQGVVTQALLCVGIYRNPTDAPVFSVLYK